MDNPIETPSQAVRALLDAGWAQSDLARAAHILQSTVSRIKADGKTDYLTGRRLMTMARRGRKPPRSRYSRRTT